MMRGRDKDFLDAQKGGSPFSPRAAKAANGSWALPTTIGLHYPANNPGVPWSKQSSKNWMPSPMLFKGPAVINLRAKTELPGYFFKLIQTAEMKVYYVSPMTFSEFQRKGCPHCICLFVDYCWGSKLSNWSWSVTILIASWKIFIITSFIFMMMSRWCEYHSSACFVPKYD